MSIISNVTHDHGRLHAPRTGQSINIAPVQQRAQLGYSGPIFTTPVNGVGEIVFQRITDNVAKCFITLDGKYARLTDQFWIKISDCMATAFHLFSPFCLPVFRQNRLVHGQELGRWSQLVGQVTGKGK